MLKSLFSEDLTRIKSRSLKKRKLPVDVYGVGSALIHGQNDFTADVVMVEGKRCTKVGREYRKLI